jgi:ABC-type transporter Mla MlaB component
VFLVRTNGSVQDPLELGSASHLCWPYDDVDEFHDIALGYVADGLMAGERVLCVVDEPVRSSLLSLDPSASSLAGTTGPALQVFTVAEAYDIDNPKSPEAQLDFYDAATRQALADGYAGLRVLADVTGVMAHPERWNVQLAWEHLADDYIANGPGMSAMCAYRTDLIAADVIADVACLHPLVREAAPGEPGLGEPAFRLFFDHESLVLAGALDGLGADRLLRALASSHVRRPDMTLDVSQLDVIDGPAASVLASWGRSQRDGGATVRLTGASPTLRELWSALGYRALDDTAVTGSP